jgi:rubredoxin
MPQAAKPRLIEGQNMTCPRCRRSKDILAYERLMEIDTFVEETTAIYKCPSCRWVFAPADRVTVGHGPLWEATGG